MQRFLIVILAALINMVFPLSADGEGSIADGDSRIDRMAVRLAELYGRHAPAEEVDRVLAQEFSVRPLGSDPIPGQVRVAAAADSRDVILDQPTLTVDDIQNKWLMVGRFRWRHDCESGPCWLKDKDAHGGEDGFAIKVNVPIQRNSASLALYSNCTDKDAWDTEVYGQPSSDEAPDGKEYGVGFKAQDRSRYHRNCPGKMDDEYNWDSGVIVETFDFATPCTGQRIQVKTLFGHSWQRTNLTGFSIGLESFGINWDRQEHHFDVIVRTPTYFDC